MGGQRVEAKGAKGWGQRVKVTGWGSKEQRVEAKGAKGWGAKGAKGGGQRVGSKGKGWGTKGAKGEKGCQGSVKGVCARFKCPHHLWAQKVCFRQKL